MGMEGGPLVEGDGLEHNFLAENGGCHSCFARFNPDVLTVDWTNRD